MQNKERAMFGKSKDDNDQLPSAVQQPQPAATKSAERVSANEISTISRGMTVAGKIVGEGTVHVLKDRQNVRTMLSMCPAPYCNARRPSATSRQRQPRSRAIANPMGCQAMMNPLTWEHRSLTRQRVSITY